jgi:hypothetical protein
MWRPAHGATSRPGPCRPASGYGRGVGRPGPRVSEADVEEASAPPSACALEPAWFAERAEAPGEMEAPVTP